MLARHACDFDTRLASVLYLCRLDVYPYRLKEIQRVHMGEGFISFSR